MDAEVETNQSLSHLSWTSVGVKDLYGSLLIIISVFILTINGLLLFVIYSSKYLHRRQNAFVVSLAISDILNGFVEGPFFAHITLNRPEQLPPHACVFVFFVSHYTKASVSFSLMALCIERCLAVSMPLKYQSIVTNRSCAITIILIWVVSAFFTALPLLRDRIVYDKDKMACTFEGHNRRYTLDTIILYIVFSRLIPTFVILVCMTTTLDKARSRFKFSTIIAAVPFAAIPVAYPLNLKKITIKALRSLLYLSIIFSVLTIVCCASGIQRAIRNDNFPPVYEMILEFISLSYYFITPVIILIFNRQYQNRIVSLFCKRCVRTNRVEQDPSPQPT